MAAAEIPTTSFRDFATSAYGNQGLELDETAAFETLVSGAGNGVKFEFASAGYIVFYNSGGSTVTFTIKLDEPDNYSNLGITFSDKVITVAGNSKHLLPVDSRYRTESDGMVYIECNTASNCKLQVTKRYTIS